MKTIEILGLEPKRLDIALAEVLELSRSKAQKIISDGRVLVNGKETNAHELVSSASKVEIADPAAPVIDPNAKPPAPLDILYEDADVLVVNKPAGLLVHPTTASTEPTLLDLLRAHIPGLDAVGDDKARAGIVHRLDKLASGVLIAAKTPEAFTHLKAQFAQRLTEKRYTAPMIRELSPSLLPDRNPTPEWPHDQARKKERTRSRILTCCIAMPAQRSLMFASKPDAHTKFACTSSRSATQLPATNCTTFVA